MAADVVAEAAGQQAGRPDSCTAALARRRESIIKHSVYLVFNGDGSTPLVQPSQEGAGGSPEEDKLGTSPSSSASSCSRMYLKVSLNLLT